jgi:hypothetical protein
MRIPRLIHQTWRDTCVPAGLLGFQRSWRELPGFAYQLWTDESMHRFVAERYPDFLTVFDGYPLSIMRVDAARYLWMHAYGGVYADLDMERLRPLDDLLRGREVVLGLEPDAHVGRWVQDEGLRRIVGNAFLASRPGHPFWEHVIARLHESRSIEDPLSATGPFFLTRAVAEYPDRAGLSLFASNVIYPASKAACWGVGGDSRRLELPAEAVTVHHWVGTWWRSGALETLAGPPILVATPVKNGAAHLDTYFAGLARLSYPADKISLAFLVSDSDDNSLAALEARLPELRQRYARVELMARDFAFRPAGPRWAPAIQRQRRAILAHSRNELVQRALRDEERVLWLDVDVRAYPADVVQQLLAAGKDIVVPHCLGPDGRTFDLNSFQLDGLDEPAGADGLRQPPRGRGRRYLEDLRGAPTVRLDGVGGTMLLVRADLHREGLLFPTAPVDGYIETEGFAALARARGLECWGIPDLEIWHG